jgi:hypothetical protein
MDESTVDNGGQDHGRHCKNIEADLRGHLRVIDHGPFEGSECTLWTNRGIILEEAKVPRCCSGDLLSIVELSLYFGVQR